MSFEIPVTPEVRALLRDVATGDCPTVLKVTPPRTERLFEVGDRVTIYGDHGRPLPAEILEVWGDSVRVSYQGGRFTTAMPKSSIVTDHVIEHPAQLEVVA
jgi:hypothetical protein